MLGIAVGQFGMSVTDFDGLTPQEFTAIGEAASRAEEARLHDAWERTRMLATIIVQPFVKSKITPKKLLQFPWDDASKPDEHEPERSTPERFEQLVKYFEEKDGK